MRLLLDTHLLLWSAEGPAERLPAEAAALIGDEANDLFFSAASIWEIALKNARGRDDFRADPQRLRRGLSENGYTEIPITSEHAAAVSHLPPIHKDPFDRILVAQARLEGTVLLTSDATLAEYGAPARRV
jgi:PIN domain nuclease of toxin-antitoxin system